MESSSHRRLTSQAFPLMIVKYLNNIFGMTFDTNPLLRALPKVLDYCKPRYQMTVNPTATGSLDSDQMRINLDVCEWLYANWSIQIKPTHLLAWNRHVK